MSNSIWEYGLPKNCISAALTHKQLSRQIRVFVPGWLISESYVPYLAQCNCACLAPGSGSELCDMPLLIDARGVAYINLGAYSYVVRHTEVAAFTFPPIQL